MNCVVKIVEPVDDVEDLHVECRDVVNRRMVDKVGG